MAEARFSQDEFMCPVCLDLLKEPVTLNCGHSFCNRCITDCWDQEDEKEVYSCPNCRQTFGSRPALSKNTILAEMEEKLKRIKPPADCYAGSGDVQCDVCTGKKYKAIKSCLVCQESYCKTHFGHHEEFHSRKPHKVIDATGRLKDMICHKHEKELEMYCITDQQSICGICKEYEHKYHKTVSTAAQRTEKQKELKGTQMKFQQRVQQRHKDLLRLREAVESQKRFAQTAVEDTERIFSEIIRNIERRCSELTQMFRDMEKTAVNEAEGLIEQLGQEINDLRRRDTELEQLSHSEDHMFFLQSFQSLSAPLKSTDVSFSPPLCFDGLRESVCKLQVKLKDFFKEEIEKISDRVTFNNTFPKTRNNFKKYSQQFTMDLNTMNSQLRLSKKHRAILFHHAKKRYKKHPERFDHCNQVLCTESISGHCYCEIEWYGQVYISLSYKSISRKGDGIICKFGHNDQSWSLSCYSAKYSFIHNDIKTDLPMKPICNRIGVYVDHIAGILSFYSVSATMSLIHSVHTTFTQPLYLGFWVTFISYVKIC